MRGGDAIIKALMDKGVVPLFHFMICYMIQI